MKRQITVTKATRKQLEKLFKVTERTIFNALDLSKPGNDLHKRIRKAAMNCGGVVTVVTTDLECFHDEPGGPMRQYLPNGAILEFYRTDGTGHIFFRGKEVATFENVTIPMIYEIQKQAAALR